MRNLLRLLVVAGSLNGCSLVLPEPQDLPTAQTSWTQVLDPNCIVQNSDIQLRASVNSDAQFEYIRRVNRIETAVARQPLIGGNKVILLQDGPNTHAAQLTAISKAKHHIHLDVYLLTDDDVGKRYEQALIERADQGVKVRLITDGLGGLGAGLQFRENLANHGIELRIFNSVNPLKDIRLWKLTRRSHRKLLIVDGAVAFTGGINITDAYSSPSLSGSSNGENGWRDTHIQVYGPAVAEFQKLFLLGWEKLAGPIESDDRYYPQASNQGNSFIRMVSDEGEDLLQQMWAPVEYVSRLVSDKNTENTHRIYGIYLAAISEAKSKVWITQAYFAPNDGFVRALKAAAKRGVDVRILMPGESDVGLMQHAARAHYQNLLNSGIKLYEYQPSMIHAKTAVIDGAWSTVGSSNLDYRSFIFNDEANAIVVGSDFAEKMEAMFLADLANAKAIDAEQWRHRNWTQKVKQRLAAFIKPLI